MLGKLILAGNGRLSALAVLLGLVSVLGFPGESRADSARVRLSGHIPQAAVAQAHFLGRVNQGEKISLALALPLRDPAGLADTLRRLYDPHDSLYGQYLTGDEFTRRFGPTEQSYRAVMAFARAKGLTITGTHPNRLLLDVSASASAVNSAFGVHLLRYQAHDGRLFHAPDAEPLIPAALVGRLNGVIGLSDAIQARPLSRRLSPPLSLPRRPISDLPVFGAHPSLQPAFRPNDIGNGPYGGLTPNDIKYAYNLDQTQLTGSGRTLGLLELDGYTPSDITFYENYYNLPNVPLKNILVDGFDGQPGGGAGEVTLDIQLMTALAAGVSQLLVYEGPNSGQGLVDTYSRIASDNTAKEISSSWGIPEKQQGLGPLLAAENTIFQQFAAQGQSFYAAAGDSGAYDDGTDLGVDDPASQPFVVGVGGTTLFLNGVGGPYQSEGAWGTPATISGGGGGGGISAVWPIPDYQSGTAGVASNTQRNVPDVSLDANPDTGYSIYLGGWTVYGGTSCAAPLWAAFTSLVNQQRSANGLADLGFPNPTIYQIGASADYNNGFHDVNDNSTNLFYHATVGYDDATGWGSFNGVNLINLMAPVPGTSNNSLVSLVFQPQPAYAGHPVTATLTIANPAPAGGLTVTLVSSDPVTLPVNATVTVPTNATTVTFPLSPAAITTSKIITVTATIPTSTIASKLTVLPVPAIIIPQSLALASSSVFGGTSTSGIISLNGPAPGAGLVVTLTRSNPVAVIPLSVPIPAGAVSATFTIGTQSVTQNTSVTLTATANGVTVPATLIVTAPAIGPVVLSPMSVVGGHSSLGSVTLNGPAPFSGITIALSSDSPVVTPVPSSITIPGGSITGTFTVTTQVVPTLTKVKVHAAYNGLVQSAVLTVEAGDLAALTVSPTGVISGGGVTGTVTLDSPAAAGGATVALVSSGAAARVPATVVVPAGATVGTFPIATASVAAPATVTISGTLNGLTQSALLAVTPIRVKSLILSPTIAAVGSTVTGTVTLTLPALAGGATVTLASSSAVATVPPAVVIPAGTTTATFPVTPVSGGGTTISATAGGQTQTAGLTVVNSPGTTFPAGLNFLSVPYDYSGVSPDSVFGITGIKMAVWQPDLDEYVITPNAPADALHPGVGYWVRLAKATTLTRVGVPTAQTTDFQIPLSAGWNQIGDPFPFGIKRSGISVRQNGVTSSFLAAATGTPLLVSDLVYSYTPGPGGAAGSYTWVRDADSLQSGSGYWVYAYQPVTLIIPHSGG